MIQAFSETLHRNIAKAVIGKDEIIDRVIAALLAGGHVLFDDMSGTGKATLVKALAKSMGCQQTRIQFTPDLLPGDITGMHDFNQKTQDVEFRKGAVFTDILLADEINRTNPRTQSALLECMEEKQVTVEGMTYSLPEPFFVIATQNPVETQRTCSLSETQLDRFLLCLHMGYPEYETEKRILLGESTPVTEAVCSVQELMTAREEVQKVSTSDTILAYLLSIAEKTRKDRTVQVGISTRGVQAMHQMAKAWAAMHGRNYLIPEDIQETAAEVMAHRLVMKGGALLQKMDFRHESALRILEEVPVPAESC